MKEIALAIAEGFKLLKVWIEGSERRQYKRAIDSAESYIRVNERVGKYADMTDKKIEELLTHYSKRFWANN